MTIAVSGSDVWSPILGTFCDDSPPAPIYSTGNYVYIEWSKERTLVDQSYHIHITPFTRDSGQYQPAFKCLASNYNAV